MSETGTGAESPNVVTEEVEQTESPEITGDAELTEGQSEAPATDEQIFTVKYQGEELDVPLNELLNGYLRQQDYTRKTQEVAELRAFNEAYQNNPVAVIQALAEANGLSIADAKALANQVAEQTDEFEDPYAAKIANLEAEVGAQKQAALEAQLIAETENAIAKYGLDGVTPDNLMAYAVQKRIGDPFTAAELLKNQFEQEEKARQTSEIVQKKRQASVVNGGSSTSNGATSDDFSGMDFGDIFKILSSRGG